MFFPLCLCSDHPRHLVIGASVIGEITFEPIEFYVSNFYAVKTRRTTDCDPQNRHRDHSFGHFT
jgi:hypothetical protein